MVGQRLAALWSWALGELRETEQPLQDNLLLQLVGAAVCISLFGSLRLDIHDAYLLRGSWLAGMHGGLPLTAVVAWWLWRQRADALSVLLGVLGGVLVALPTAARFWGRGSIQLLRAYELPVFLAVAAGFVLLWLAARRSRLALADFGLGLGDWRWWLPRAAAAAVVIVVGVAVAIHTFADLARFYPSVHAARNNLEILLASQGGMVLGIFGWEMLFRGVLLWVFARRGDIKGAIEANAIIFFLGHIDKPTSEMFISLPGGIIACWFGWRARSFVPVWLLHSLQLFAINAAGFWMRQ